MQVGYIWLCFLAEQIIQISRLPCGVGKDEKKLLGDPLTLLMSFVPSLSRPAPSFPVSDMISGNVSCS